jgi:hypothetical protein
MPRDDVFGVIGSAAAAFSHAQISVDFELTDKTFKARLPNYMYATTIGNGFDAVHFGKGDQSVRSLQKCTSRGMTVVLARRDGAFHFWDCLLEKFSYYLTV